MTNFDFASVDPDIRVCVYCLNLTFAYVCPTCNEYKGLMPVNQETCDYLDVHPKDIIDE